MTCHVSTCLGLCMHGLERDHHDDMCACMAWAERDQHDGACGEGNQKTTFVP